MKASLQFGVMKIEAKVVQGVQIGAKFGIATANLELSALPEITEGVYLVRVRLEEEVYDGLFHFGPRKTFGGDNSAEVHILDFAKDIYGETLEITLAKKLRDVQAFKNADQLFTQIETDILVARKYFMRQRVRAQWKALSLHDQALLSATAVNHISAKAEFLEASSVFVYAPQMGKEIGFVATLMTEFPEKKYYFPVIKKNALAFYRVKEYKNLKAGTYGILAPNEAGEVVAPQAKDLMFVPAVAADKMGNRLGQGGGFYDKYLSTLDYKVKTLAVLPNFALVKQVPTEKHDESLDGVIWCEV